MNGGGKSPSPETSFRMGSQPPSVPDGNRFCHSIITVPQLLTDLCRLAVLQPQHPWQQGRFRPRKQSDGKHRRANRPTHGAAMTDAARCDDGCNALQRPAHRAAVIWPGNRPRHGKCPDRYAQNCLCTRGLPHRADCRPAP